MKKIKMLFGLGSGGTSLLLNMLLDTVLALLGRIGWKVIVERAVTRIAFELLDWLASMSTNKLTKEFVQDIRDEMSGIGLPKASEKGFLSKLAKSESEIKAKK